MTTQTKAFPNLPYNLDWSADVQIVQHEQHSDVQLRSLDWLEAIMYGENTVRMALEHPDAAYYKRLDGFLWVAYSFEFTVRGERIHATGHVHPTQGVAQHVDTDKILASADATISFLDPDTLSAVARYIGDRRAAKDPLVDRPPICDLSTGIAHSANRMDEIATLARETNNLILALDKPNGIEQFAMQARTIWNNAAQMEPDSQDRQTFREEATRGWDGTEYMRDAPHDEARAVSAGKSAARAIAAMCRLMAAQYEQVGKT